MEPRKPYPTDLTDREWTLIEPYVPAALGPLRRCPIGKEHEGTDHLIAPLDLINEAQLQLRKCRGRVHRSPFTCAAGEGLM
jgi:hypothetical protein